MPTLAETAAVLESYAGFKASRTRTVARRLLEEKLLTPGAPGVAVEITEADFVLLLLALASGASLSRVADVAAQLSQAVSDWMTPNDMPAHLRPTRMDAFTAIHDQVWAAARNPKAIVFDVEVVETWREVVVHKPDGPVYFVPLGTLPGSSRQRRATRIPSSALFLAAHNLFKETK